MVKNYLTTTLRHLWRQRLFTVLNIVGLAIGISSCWLIYRISVYEFSFDDNIPHRDNIVKVITAKENQRKMGGVAPPLHQGVRNEVTGIKNTVPVVIQWVNMSVIHHPHAEDITKDDPQDIVATNASYFNMLPYKWLAGSKKKAFSSKDNVVLTESRARDYFPKLQLTDILNQTITYYGTDTIQRVISGIVADYYTPSEFTGKEFMVLDDDVTYQAAEWTNRSGSDKLYLELAASANATNVLKQINDLSFRKHKEFFSEKKLPQDISKHYELLPLSELHFATDVEESGYIKTNKKVIYGLMGIGIFLLALACINYINMSVAQIPRRSKEIGIRKTLGSSKLRLISQFIIETLLTAICALILSIGFVQLLFVLLKEIIPSSVNPSGSFSELFFFTLLILSSVSILAGLYPGWLISNVKTIQVLKNIKVSFSGKQIGLQKILIVFQFVIAQIFIVSTIIVGSQLRYLIKSDMGFDKDAILLVTVPWKYLEDPKYVDKQFTLLEELRSKKGIAEVSLGGLPLSSSYSSSPHEYTDPQGVPNKMILFKKTIDDAYLNVYKIPLLAGRNLRKTDTINEYVVNETAARAMGYTDPQDAIGKMINQIGNQQFPIVGVVKDFHTQNFYAPIDPLVMMSYKDNLYNFNIRLDSKDPSQWQHVLGEIENSWKKFYPSATFNYHFYDETLQELYTQERRLGKLINIATGITVLISCLGLFGLSTLTAFQRTKEIGIRKVLGSSILNIIGLLSKDFVKLVCIAIIIASPIAWWATKTWLLDFTYRISISWWMFATAAIGALIIALTTVSYQALRASKANPVDSLRDE